MIDDWVMDRCESFSHRFQKLTGFTCFWLGKWCAVVSFVLYTMIGIQMLNAGLSTFSDFMYGELFVFIFVVALVVICENGEYNFSRGSEFCNPIRTHQGFVFARTIEVVGTVAIAALVLLLILSGIVESIPVLIFLLQVSITLSIYFASCTPLPPQKSKMREWLEQAQAWARREPEGDALPA